ncbi:MAG: CDP-alcohol phosphatidyltransferase family protein [Spirochaetota bacterium]
MQLLLKAGLALAAIFLLGVLVAYPALHRSGMSASALRYWVAGFTIALSVQGVLLFRFLPLNRRQRSPEVISSQFGVANSITVSRAGLNSACIAFAFVEPAAEWVAFPLALYVGSIVLDFFDGYIARITGTTSRMGEALEHEFDSIGVIAATAVAWSWGSLSIVYLIAAPARTIYLVAEYVRRARGGIIHPLRYTISSRIIAGLYMGFLCVALVPGFPVPLLRVGGPLFLVPLVGGFVRDWMVATGTLLPDGERYRSLSEGIRTVVLGWLPVLLRALAAGMCVLLAVHSPGTPAAVALFAGALMIALGFAARVGALGMLGVIAFPVYATTGPTAMTIAAFLLCAALVVLGSGHASLAKPEEYPFARRIG